MRDHLHGPNSWRRAKLVREHAAARPRGVRNYIERTPIESKVRLCAKVGETKAAAPVADINMYTSEWVFVHIGMYWHVRKWLNRTEGQSHARASTSVKEIDPLHKRCFDLEWFPSLFDL
jgi:hypothetical protein